jgi:hypothetical protein
MNLCSSFPIVTCTRPCQQEVFTAQLFRYVGTACYYPKDEAYLNSYQDIGGKQHKDAYSEKTAAKKTKYIENLRRKNKIYRTYSGKTKYIETSGVKQNIYKPTVKKTAYIKSTHDLCTA